jgi:hypothetical protein
MLGQVEAVFETVGSVWEALKRFDQLDVDVNMHLPTRNEFISSGKRENDVVSVF